MIVSHEASPGLEGLAGAAGVLGLLPVAVVAFDDAGRSVWWNAEAEALLGFDIGNAKLDSLRELCEGRLAFQSAAAEGLIWVTVTEAPTDKDLVEQFAHQALHDHLTGLPNRVLLADRIYQALSRASRSGKSVAVAFLDLDHFKLINDTQGHAEGDALLRAAAERLSGAVRVGDTVARFGGDEFVIVYEGVAGREEAIQLGERVRKVLEAPFTLCGEKVYVSASLGVAVGTSQATAEDLLRDADAAMYHAKLEGRARTQIFDDEIRARASWRRNTEKALRRAIEAGEFTLAYQPIVAVDEGWVVGAEALLRWDHPERGPVPPGDFMPVAEETGLILPLGEWVFDTACRQLDAWRREITHVPLFMSINISARQLRAGAGDLLLRTAAKYRLDPSKLMIEITEGSVMADVAGSLDALNELHRTGVQIALDDFGVGYSALNYLKRFPIDVIKIDRSFIAGLGTDANDSAIVSAIAAIARGLKVSVVAEGVETPDHLYGLRRLGCRYAQGCFFARPLDPEVLADLVRSRPRW
jgi:diguanylate cyclase (GGDEF)-like protein